MRTAVWLVLFLLPRLAAAQAHLVKDLATGPASPYGSSSNPFQMKAVGATLYFSATTLDFGTELWKSDGTAAGTSMVADLRLGSFSSNPYALTAFGSRLLFIATDDAGTWLWSTEGTPATTKKIARADEFSWIAPIGERVLFTRTGGVWSSDGTPEGTHLVVGSLEFYNFPRAIAPFHGGFAFATTKELWVTDGTAAGTRRVRGGFAAISDMI